VRLRSISPLRGKETLHAWYRVVITQGLNRQIRNMFSKVGHDVIKLQRVGIGSLEIGALPKGQFKFLTLDQAKKALQDPENKPKKERQKSSKRI